MPPQTFGTWLRLKRKALDLTQEGLADQVGCSAATIRKLEAEERRPSTQIVQRLAQILDIPTHEQAAFLRFARGDWQAAPQTPEADLPWRAPQSGPPAGRPMPLTTFIGREQVLAGLRARLTEPDVRLLTLIGP